MAKILVISDNYVPLTETRILGGAEATLMNQIKVLKENGHEIIVLSPDDTKLDNYQMQPIGQNSKLWFTSKGEKPPRNLNALTNKAIDYVLSNVSIDLIINHHKQPTVLKHLAHYAAKYPVVSHVHNAPIFGMLSLNTNKAYAILSEAGGANWGVSGWCTRTNNSLVAGTATDTFIVQIAMERKEVLEPEYQASIVGRFVDWKNLHNGIKPICEGDITGRVVGYAEDESDPYYQKMIKPLVEGNPNWYTGITHKETMEVVGKSQFFLQTSHSETSSCTQFEAAQMGVPSIICTKRNGHGSFENSFLPDWAYMQIDTYFKGTPYIAGEFIRLVQSDNEYNNQELNFKSLELRKQLADYIYDNFNKDVWYSKFVTKVNETFERFGKVL